MAIVVEDGSIVEGANSYLSLEAVRAFALARGVTLSSTDALVEQQLILAADYIESKEIRFVGYRADPENQVLCWPRNAYCVRSDEVPAKIRQAQGFLVMAQASATPVNILPVGSPPEPFPVTKKKLGPLEKTYAATPGAVVPTLPTVPAAEEALAFYYKRSGSRLEVY